MKYIFLEFGPQHIWENPGNKILSFVPGIYQDY